MLCILRAPPTGGSAVVEFRLENGTNFVGADGGGHEDFGELFGEIRDSLGLLVNHGGLHLSAADGGTTMPELARWVQVRDVVRRSTSLGLQAKGHRFVGVGHPVADSPSTLARGSWLGMCAMGRWMIRCSRHRQTAFPARVLQSTD